MKGHIRQRGEHSFELKFDPGRDPATGKRKIQYSQLQRHEARGSRSSLPRCSPRSEQAPTSSRRRSTVADFVRARVDQWEAAGDISARTAQRYRQLVENQIVPHHRQQDAAEAHPPRRRGMAHDTAQWRACSPHASAMRTGCSARRWAMPKATALVVKNVCKLQKAPKVAEREMVIVQDVPAFVAKIRRRSPVRSGRRGVVHRHAVGRGPGACRERGVDLDRQVVEVREALEETKAKGIVFKTPKSKAGRRDITLPDIAVEALAGAPQGAPRNADEARPWQTRARRSAVRQSRRADRFGPAPCHRTGASLPGASACRKSRSTRCGIPTPAS